MSATTRSMKRLERWLELRGNLTADEREILADVLEEARKAQIAAFKIEELAKELARSNDSLTDARAKLRMCSAGVEDVWFWESHTDRAAELEANDPASLACPVVMPAARLRAFVHLIESLEGQLAAAIGGVNDACAIVKIYESAIQIIARRRSADAAEVAQKALDEVRALL